MSMAVVVVKCRKCRLKLLDSVKTPLLTVHNEHVQNNEILKPNLDGDCTQIKDEFFLGEDGLPDWILQTIDEAQWLRGKLNCPQCSARVGSFNFVTGQQCPCAKYVVPPIHIVKSKVDCNFEFHPTSGITNTS